MGQMHVEMVVERMKRKYNVDVLVLPPRIPYKETVKGRAEVQGKYKKQTGGRGQYGDTWLKIEPLVRGGGFEFVDDIFGGAIPRNFIPSVREGRARLHEARDLRRLPGGGPQGHPLRRLLPRRGLLRHGVPDRRVAWGCRRASWRRIPSCSSR